MVKRIRILLDYGCYPVWLYDENDDVIDTLLPEELRSDIDLDKKFDDLQARYEALFINDAHEFSRTLSPRLGANHNRVKRKTPREISTHR